MPRTFIRNLTGKVRTRKADIQLGVMLAFIAGAINAGGFLAVGQYTSHMSGIASSLGDYIALHQTQAALLALGFLAAFISGAVISTLIINWARTRTLHGEFALALMLEAVLLLVFGVFADPNDISVSRHHMIELLCFIMGLQNAIITKVSNAEIRTTHVTGLATDIGIELGRLLYAFRDPAYNATVQIYKLKLHISLISAFIIGGIVGAVAFDHFGFMTTVPLALILTVAASVPILDDFGSKRTK